MRGERRRQANMLMSVAPDELVPRDHPIREIKAVVERALTGLSPVFDKMHARIGRASVPPGAF